LPIWPICPFTNRQSVTSGANLQSCIWHFDFGICCILILILFPGSCIIPLLPSILSTRLFGSTSSSYYSCIFIRSGSLPPPPPTSAFIISTIYPDVQIPWYPSS
jgi:hypothetical protein